MINFEEFESDLNVYISEVNIDDLIYLFSDLKDHVDEGDIDAIEYVATPRNITRIHKSLASDIGVPVRFLQLRNRVPNAARRASQFMRGILHGLEYLNKEK